MARSPRQNPRKAESTLAAKQQGGKLPKTKPKEMSDLEYAQKLEVECVYWPTSRLVAHIAWSSAPRMGVVIFPQVDVAVAKELDRRLPAPTKMERTRRGTL